MSALDWPGLHEDLHLETAFVLSMVSRLDDDEWQLATPAPGWTVADQISHLAYFDDMTVLAIRDPDRFRVERPSPDAVESLTETVAERFRTLTGHELLEWFERARAAMVATTRPLDARTRIPWYGPDMSLASAVTARLMETWAHGQDIADSFGIAHPVMAGIRHVCDLGVRTMANGFLAHGRTPPEVAIRVELTGPAGERWTWGPEETAGADRVEGSAEAFALVVTQRRHPDDVDLRATGAVAQEWLGVAQAFAGPPGEKRRPSTGS